jgi:hypothetical protein
MSITEGLPLNLGLGDDELIAMLAISGGLFVAVLSIVLCSVKSVLRSRDRERTRREVAAYVAEGSISPQDAKEILEAGMPHWEKGCRKA